MGTIRGCTFNLQQMTSADRAHESYIQNGGRLGISKGCELSYSGNDISITSGYINVYGRLTEIEGTYTITADDVNSGTVYEALVYTIDLTKTNTQAVFNQGYFEILTDNSDYPALTQENLDDGGEVYQFLMAQFTVSQSGIANFVDKANRFSSWTEITLSTTGWSASGNGFEQTIALDTVSVSTMADMRGIVYPDNCTDAARKSLQIAAAPILYMTTGNGSITFYATKKPSVAITLAIGGV